MVDHEGETSEGVVSHIYSLLADKFQPGISYFFIVSGIQFSQTIWYKTCFRSQLVDNWIYLFYCLRVRIPRNRDSVCFWQLFSHFITFYEFLCSDGLNGWAVAHHQISNDAVLCSLLNLINLVHIGCIARAGTVIHSHANNCRWIWHHI